ncbi:MAG: 6-phosphogluconolactonase [Planctomycetota bacterium]
MPTTAVTICESPNDLALRTADTIVDAAAAAIRERGRFLFVLSGGRTPEKAYSLLSQANRAIAIDWSKVFVFLGDERMVPAVDPRNNFAMARRTLLDRVPIPATQVFAVRTDGRSAAAAAAEYNAELTRFFAADPHNASDRFDLVLLGMGEDGHTASLFPNARALDVKETWATWSPPGLLPPSVDRVTLTYPAINSARQVLFVVAGEEKATALYEVLEGNASPTVRPAAGVHPSGGTLTWITDRNAGQLLKVTGNHQS